MDEREVLLDLLESSPLVSSHLGLLRLWLNVTNLSDDWAWRKSGDAAVKLYKEYGAIPPADGTTPFDWFLREGVDLGILKKHRATLYLPPREQASQYISGINLIQIKPGLERVVVRLLERGGIEDAKRCIEGSNPFVCCDAYKACEKTICEELQTKRVIFRIMDSDMFRPHLDFPNVSWRGLDCRRDGGVVHIPAWRSETELVDVPLLQELVTASRELLRLHGAGSPMEVEGWIED